MSNVSGILCGRFVREEWELWGRNRVDGAWYRAGIYDAEHKVKSAFADPTMQKGYPHGLAWTFRRVEETREIGGATVPQFQLVMQMRGEDGEPGDVIKTDYETPHAANQGMLLAEAMPDCLFAHVVDLSTGRKTHGK